VSGVPNWITDAAARHPDRIAIEGPERSLTYAELRDAAGARAVAVRARRVALALPAGEDFVIALHACLLAGATAVPIDLRLSAAEQARRRDAVDASGGEPAGEDSPVAVMHTSGTTAMPKPVVLSRANFLASALGSAVALGLDPAERWLCPMPLTHVGGLSIPIRSAIYATTAVLHGRFDTEAVLSDLMDPDRRITLVSLVPTMLARLLDAGLQEPPTLRWALLGGGPTAPALLDRAAAAGVPVAPTYGMTEACSQIATFGWPLAGVDVRLADDDEVLVRGPIVSAGAISEDGWLHTGDLGRLDERDRLEIIGRKADTIVSGGENVAPAEVEAVLLEHPAVADAAVHPRADPEWGEVVVATVVVRAGASVDPDELRGHCAARLAAFKVPKVVELAEGLPRTPSGKLLRRQL
jgi:O-succinylbenzoic acid--CoA ligase